MEEKKKTRTAAMKPQGAQAAGQEGRKAPTYEELNNYCLQLHEQNQALIREVRQRDAGNLFKRLDYLFMVLSHKDSFGMEFTEACAAEIEHAITGPTEEELAAAQAARDGGKEA